MADEPTKRANPHADPPTVVVVFGLLTAAGLWCVGMLGATTAALALGAAIAVSGGALMVLRARSLRRARNDRVAREPPPAAAVVSAITLIGVVAAAPYVLIRAAGLPLEIDEVGRLWPLRGIALAAVCITGSVHLSALVDWGYIRLRLRGVLGDRVLPCQRNESTNWDLLTRLWLGHRLAAYVIVRTGLVAIIGLAAAGLQPTDDKGTADSADAVITQPSAVIVGAIGAAVLVFFLNRLLPVATLVSNSRVQVGDRIVLAEEFGTGVAQRPVYYVVDVAIEGIKLLELDDAGHPRGAAGRDPRRGHDRSLSLADVPRLLRFRSRFNGCAVVCSRASHNCPRAFGEPVMIGPSEQVDRVPGEASEGTRHAE